MYTIEEFDEQKTRIMKYIVYKRRTEKEVRDKFKNSMEEEILNDIIEYLKDAKYIDDNDYLRKMVQNIMILKTQSIKEIQYKLLSKGIKKDEIERYIYINEEELEEYELNCAKKIILKKSDKDENEIRAYLIRKGYKLENIRKAIDEINQK
mgnify:FL=1